ncbi:PIR Superfamily Protein [Plasmodium ovale curtisi]|uniref:PIR Superfamily Protein n=1 Tax=Plasmodium ovale curtisi TaxID=864141 RepID=A0A1A8WJ77_PLAOA|nr:PIR Superfamily Protein [Plasmodium ovale curtisi]
MGKLNELQYYQIFYKVRENFNNIVDDEYDAYLYKKDQVLQNIGIYLVENYNGDYNACSIYDDCVERCKHLNKWLNEKKALYTSNGKCTNNNELWNRYIDKLWEKLEQGMKKENRCKRDNGPEKDFNKKWITHSCSNATAVVIPQACPHSPTPPAVPDRAPEVPVCPESTALTSSSCKAVLTTTYVVFGILLFFMYFLRFSSVGMKLYNLIRGGKIKRRNVDKENNESFRSDNNSNMESLDRRFNVIYNSFQN